MLDQSMIGLVSGVLVAAGVCFFAWRNCEVHSVSRAGLVWVDGFSAEFVDRDLRVPEESCTGRIYANVVRRPIGIRMEKMCADRERVSISGEFNQPYVEIDPVTRTYWKPKVRSSLRVTSHGPGQPMEPMVGSESAVRRYVGRERVNGRAAEHWEISDPRANGETLVWQYWEDVRLHAALKQDIPGIRYYELRNIREGGQPAALFQMPNGYSEVAAP